MDHRPLILAIHACRHASAPDRHLDARIALAVFPALGELPMLSTGVWRHSDGSRVRALRYSASCAAAGTLVPAGCWLEIRAGEAQIMEDQGSWSGFHALEAIAICIAALRAQLNRKSSDTHRRMP